MVPLGMGRRGSHGDMKSHSVFTECFGWNCVSPNSYVEAVTPSVTVFGDRISKEVIQVKSWPSGLESLEEEEQA